MFDQSKVFLGITPTVWTNDDFQSLGDDIGFEQCISEMALAGFQGCSVGHKFPKDPVTLKAALDLRGLRVSEPWASTYFTIADMEARTMASFQEQLAFIKAMGGTDIVVAELGRAVHQQPVSLLPNRPVMNDAEWRLLTEGLNRLGRIARDEGMRLCYHHHLGTVVQSRADVDRLMAETDPEVVFLLLDTGHLLVAGDDPLAMTRAHANRIKHVHLKDIRLDVWHAVQARHGSFFEGVMAGFFTVPGDGVIDFRPILQTLSDHGYEGWLMVEAEQDATQAHPLTYALKARAYLRDVIGW
ncbi:myo-inosose-2 dehydratase [Gemmatimonas sp.]|jgi:inosose dehydratase|uniref:myo-inosose-2 dehydratase n=1 Tax=Gemmatimonas sp. TaxID=1962908 RepID=UPI0022BEB254|nr:myo-inosose-2 dehydratase [Gemmatimonas sp.]MCZ8205835.1 myo-inosose-2 dehydratase [Gemmatimonas sp.]